MKTFISRLQLKEEYICTMAEGCRAFLGGTTGVGRDVFVYILYYRRYIFGVRKHSGGVSECVALRILSSSTGLSSRA